MKLSKKIVNNVVPLLIFDLKILKEAMVTTSSFPEVKGRLKDEILANAYYKRDVLQALDAKSLSLYRSIHKYFKDGKDDAEYWNLRNDCSEIYMKFHRFVCSLEAKRGVK